jgi:hypothetical protein
MLIASVPPSARKRLVVTALVAGAIVGLLLFGRKDLETFVEKQMTCLSLTGGDPGRRYVQFQDSAKPDVQSALERAVYHLEVDGYCYHAECNLDLRDVVTAASGSLEPNVHCRGGDIVMIVSDWTVTGFSVPAGLKKMRVRVQRAALTVYDETVGARACLARGLCVVDSMAQ